MSFLHVPGAAEETASASLGQLTLHRIKAGLEEHGPESQYTPHRDLSLHSALHGPAGSILRYPGETQRKFNG